ncbi:hypothetical protein, variant [Spizellomyces punctatus DAOM BR117]|uniref:RRM domain-containing protein n=1 Tax=Spizellomyces punctatus (strain DAOM BR117) TaxID=645134 RepID=A0A0L0H7S9_SPIPD|nr:hypothetical protein, variant [Spizellomyces punctatus DAOM BR117]KNC97019.1 hypothetical protein, variant [Spizellomyces punctatus DAOM BR117]|eukprot:XP_016605059.1 hypothetical protein, variant [Spizellomyces punctatus DAOM BR117]
MSGHKKRRAEAKSGVGKKTKTGKGSQPGEEYIEAVGETIPNPVSGEDSQEEREGITASEAASENETENIVIEENTDSNDSSDDDASTAESSDDEFKTNRPLVLLSPEDKEALMERTRKGKDTTATSKPGVVFLGRIPHGFYEKEMKAYFSQFGDVKRLRLSRNKKTGKSKHYAFIEFSSEDTAKIVAETMDNYLLFNHLLRCKFVPEDGVHPETWKGADKKFKVIPRAKLQREKHNKSPSKKTHDRQVKSLLEKESNKRARLQALGIDYDFPGYSHNTAGRTTSS